MRTGPFLWVQSATPSTDTGLSLNPLSFNQEKEINEYLGSTDIGNQV